MSAHAFACALRHRLLRLTAWLRPALLRPSLLLPVLLLSAAAAAAAQERPRIGLALSGGGARGFSHVGVLRALETLRVPVDCIAGTSAGAAVGAAYAMGLSPDEIQARLDRADWSNDLFDDQPARPDLPYRSKTRPGGAPIGVTLGVGPDGLKGASGVLAGQKIELFLHGLLGTSREWPDFDALPIPYRAIATDLRNGEMVVQRSGSLVHAVRASMAVPSAFAPVKVGGRLLVDGGLTQNLPVKAVREACADIVIAINIGSPLLGEDELGNVFGVALQIVSILMERNVVESLAALGERDVLITPDLGPISAVDFARGTQGIPAGEAATLAAAPSLRALALDEAPYRAWQTARQSRVPVPLDVARVEVAPTRFVNPEVFRIDDAETRQPTGPVATERLHRRILQWAGSGDYTAIAYSLRPGGDGHTLWVEPQEKPWGPDYLQIGFAGSADTRGNADFSVQAALRRTWLNRQGAEWLTIARLGRTTEVNTSWFQPLGVGSPWFVEPRLILSSEPQRVYQDQDSIGEFRVGRLYADLGAGLQGRFGEARLAVVSGDFEIEPSIGFTLVKPYKATIRGLSAELTYDQLDSLDFPRAGTAVRAEFFRALRSLGSDSEFDRSEIDLTHVRSVGPHTWRGRVRYGHVSKVDAGVTDLLSVGGLFDLSGYQPDQFLGRGLAGLSLTYYNQVMPLPRPFGSGLYAGFSLEAARIRHPLTSTADSIDRFGSSIFVGAATGLGPAYVAYGFSRDSRLLYLFIGRP